MPRPKGIPKTGGRKKGTLNKSTLLMSVFLADHDYDFGTELKQALATMNLAKLVVLEKLFPYYFAKPMIAPIEIKPENPQASVKNADDLLKELEKESQK
jgi:hypothetical protein